ncbi:hypothetical protein Ade02nite_61320 [Paractinoplanes deccanensis]|uniref:DUF2255 family protein n=1 Tax=Paractinoplanes deccanensis TaxID=113561 RepID=A0ABQ3YBX2_9ACTN|nr:hypothetical protein Ade02nite_61320 [Actinoplanes deccanensis]
MLAYLRDTDTVLIEAGHHRTPIWAVEADGAGYIRSSHGTASAWYRRVSAEGRLSFVTPDGPVPVTVSLVEDDATRDAVDRAYEAKYGDQPRFLPLLVGPPARATTMRVVPVSPAGLVPPADGSR